MRLGSARRLAAAGFVSAGVLLGTFGCSSGESPPGESPPDDLPARCSAASGDAVELTEIRPPSGVASGGHAPEGPGPRRILLAESADGVTFARTGALLSDQANTPNMVVDAQGRILVYYTAYDIDPSAGGPDAGNRDGVAVAVSEDHGASWRHYCVGMAGFAAARPPIGDPDVVTLEDGTYRMYVTNGTAARTINIFSATSTDGLRFTYEGVALDTGSTDFKDSLTAWNGSEWVMFVLNSTNGHMRRATSADGRTFAAEASDERPELEIGGARRSFVLSNWFEPDDGFRIFAFTGETNDIRSFTTADGFALVGDPTVSLGLPLDATMESSWVKDAAVGRLADGTFLMAYVSEIP